MRDRLTTAVVFGLLLGSSACDEFETGQPPADPSQDETLGELRAADEPSYWESTINYALGVDDSHAGFPEAISKGRVSAEVSTDAQTGNKQISGVTYENLSIEIDAGMSDEVYNWITAAVQGEPWPRDVVLTGPLGTRRFHDARITGLGFPALSSASGPVTLSVEISPELITRLDDPADAVPFPSGGPPNAIAWSGASFMLQLGDLPCTRVTGIGAINWQAAPEGADGGTPPALSNFVVTVDFADAGPWLQWNNAFAEAENSDGSELDGTITYFAPNLNTVLGRVELTNVGVVSLELAGESEPLADNAVGNFTVELYVERLDLDWMYSSGFAM